MTSFSRFAALVCSTGWTVVAMAGDAGAAPLSGSLPAPARMERIDLSSGRHLDGLIESESDAWLNLIEVCRPPGKPMHLVIRPIAQGVIAGIARLPRPERAALQAEIDRFRNRAWIESAQMEAVRLVACDDGDVNANVNIKGLAYSGPWFTLASSLDPPALRRIVVRLEQVFTAFRQILAPRCRPARRLRLVVLDSREEYRTYLARLGLHVDNPACFVSEQNLLVVASELGAYQAELKKIDDAHEKIRTDLESLQSRLPGRLRDFESHLRSSGQPHAEIARLVRQEKLVAEKEVKDKGRELAGDERKNARALDRLSGLLFTRLYHEAFHAYLENYVYPHDRYDVPCWLNEGLAVMMERGLLDVGTLRIDAPHPGALMRLKKELADADPFPLEGLLTADQRAFLVHSGTPSAQSQRNYAAAWGLAYYLTFQRGLLEGPRLDAYVARSARSTPPLARFEQLVGTSWPQFEQAWRTYIVALR